MAVYVYIDVSQKQEFIYKDNRLKDNLYNSFIIKAITEKTEPGSAKVKILTDAFKDPAKENEPWWLSGYLEHKHKGEYRFVYSGGGNSIIRFEAEDKAREFIANYSRKIVIDYPALELYLTYVPDLGANSPKDARQIRWELRAVLDRLKDSRKSRFRRWSYGVEEIDDTGRAKPIKAKQEPDYDAARKFMVFDLESTPEFDSRLLKITNELQDYGNRETGKSYLGVIAIDGNRMGEMVAGVKDFAELETLSAEIERIYRTAVAKALAKNAARRGADTLEVPDRMLVTPVLMAGDDICLIVEAEEAIRLAADILKYIGENTKSQEGRAEERKPGQLSGLTACAGVAIARNTYPFFETVKAAERLCHRAKEAMHQVGGQAAAGSFLDWEILQGQVQRPDYEGQVRHGSYQESFHIKPLRIDQAEAVSGSGMYSYDGFSRILDGLGSSEAISSSFLAELKNAMYAGIEQYRLIWEMNHTAGSEELNRLVNSVVGEERCPYGVMQSQSQGKTRYTYLLNDILELKPFMTRGGERP